MRSILLLPLVARSLETIDVCIWHMFVFVSVVVNVYGNVCCVAAVVKDCVFSHGVLKYVCVRGVVVVVFVFWYCDAWSCRCSCMGSMSVSSCRCCMFVSCVHPVAVLNAALCMTLQFVNAGRGCKRRPYGRGILQSRSHDCLIGRLVCLLLSTGGYPILLL